MKIFEVGRSFRILPESPLEEKELKKKLMGWRQKRGDPYLVCERNNINKHILGLWFQEGLCPGDLIWDVDPNGKLRDYQRRDVVRMCNLKHCINANPMGLGKTVEMISVLAHEEAQSVLIVTPKIIRTQWADQISTWWGKQAIVYEKGDLVEENLYIVNYEKLRNEKTLLKFRKFVWDFLVLDEAHKIKNRTSKQTEAVKLIPSKRRVALTGTPITRYVDDLWSILNFLGPEYSGSSYWNFVDYFCQIEESPWGKKVVGTIQNIQRQQVLKSYLDRFMIRHDAIEVAHGKTSETIRLPMSKPQRELYRKEKQLLLDQLPENCTISNGAVLSIRLRQTTSWPGLFIEDEAGPKFEWLLNTCQDNPDEQLTVFTQFAKTADALSKYLFNNGIKTVSITGQNKPIDNEHSKERFVKGSAQVLIGTIGAMGQGYDGLQLVSRIGIFLERDWSPEINKQAEERLHRMGQDHPVHIIYLECQGSFDQHVGRINVNKSEGIRQALISEEE